LSRRAGSIAGVPGVTEGNEVLTPLLDLLNHKRGGFRYTPLLTNTDAKKRSSSSSSPSVSTSSTAESLLAVAIVAAAPQPSRPSDVGIGRAEPIISVGSEIFHDYEGDYGNGNNLVGMDGKTLEHLACDLEILSAYGFLPKDGESDNDNNDSDTPGDSSETKVKGGRSRDCAILPFVGLVRHTDADGSSRAGWVLDLCRTGRSEAPSVDSSMNMGNANCGNEDVKEGDVENTERGRRNIENSDTAEEKEKDCTTCGERRNKIKQDTMKARSQVQRAEEKRVATKRQELRERLTREKFEALSAPSWIGEALRWEIDHDIGVLRTSLMRSKPLLSPSSSSSSSSYAEVSYPHECVDGSITCDPLSSESSKSGTAIESETVAMARSVAEGELRVLEALQVTCNAKRNKSNRNSYSSPDTKKKKKKKKKSSREKSRKKRK